MDNKNIDKVLADACSAASHLSEWVSRDVLDDSSGNGEKLRMIYEGWSGAEAISERPSGFRIFGPEGCGKHTAMLHLVKLISEKKRHTLAYVNGTLLDPEEFGFPELRERFDIIIDNIGSSKPLCLILDGFDRCPYRDELYNYLGSVLFRRWFDSERELLLVIVDDGGPLPSLLSELLSPFRVRRPNRKLREKLIDTALDEELCERIDRLYGIKNLVSDTEGFTYRELLLLTNELADAIDSSADEEELHELVADAMHAAEAARRKAAQAPERAAAVTTRLISAQRFDSEPLLKRFDALAEAVSKIQINAASTPIADMGKFSLDGQNEDANLKSMDPKAIKENIRNKRVKEVLDELVNFTEQGNTSSNAAPEKQSEAEAAAESEENRQ